MGRPQLQVKAEEESKERVVGGTPTSPAEDPAMGSEQGMLEKLEEDMPRTLIQGEVEGDAPTSPADDVEEKLAEGGVEENLSENLISQETASEESAVPSGVTVVPLGSSQDLGGGEELGLTAHDRQKQGEKIDGDRENKVEQGGVGGKTTCCGSLDRKGRLEIELERGRETDEDRARQEVERDEK